MKKLFGLLALGCFLGSCASQHGVIINVLGKAPVEVQHGTIIASSKDLVVDDYTVKLGDCLWTISANKSVYNDPFCWPELYKMNAVVIGSDPDVIEPGQSLIVVRDFDKDAARGIASQWPVYKGKK